MFSSCEKKYFHQNSIVIGVDEVGVGCLAGPIVACACLFINPTSIRNIPVLIKDSKQLTPRQREEAERWLQSKIVCSFAFVHPNTIDKIGLTQSVFCVMRMSVKKLIQTMPHHFKDKNSVVLCDYYHASKKHSLSCIPQETYIKGDVLHATISTASIMAKVKRDRYMNRLAKKHPQYAWDTNKGYATKKHKEALIHYGMTPYHRRLFCKGVLGKSFYDVNHKV